MIELELVRQGWGAKAGTFLATDDLLVTEWSPDRASPDIRNGVCRRDGRQRHPGPTVWAGPTCIERLRLGALLPRFS